ncbi:hypothetical protein SDRG_04326 [Saprolegnia diclina VS20]|uniref:WW domain-containing protein n=1 Tax=Saprolegnia diclina (strain VS20) TaxID=1156394 RepID=T0QX54_SAPDV|nr:hypothetical protein SDRG_04326 [Saprolegnia diclina VS20]EQC38625.1 hypothetical protein SDRG_04326 [Saprolegnia diclina VS20]|eukprot:XP_008608217.1 hypothetical protein SDRG_04326 [Saprolegnia diclina VS20]
MLEPPKARTLRMELQTVHGEANKLVERFSVKRWQELLQLHQTLEAHDAFHCIPLSGHDRGLYETLHRSFPHDMVTKARLLGVFRGIYGLEAGADVDKPKRQLLKQLERLHYWCENSTSKIPTSHTMSTLVLNWRLLLCAFRALRYPAQSEEDLFRWSFLVFSSSGYLDESPQATISRQQLYEIFNMLSPSHACSRIINQRIAQADNLLPESVLVRGSIRFSHMQRLMAQPPLQELFAPASKATHFFHELTSPCIREYLYLARKEAQDKATCQRFLRQFKRRSLRKCMREWSLYVDARRRARETAIRCLLHLSTYKQANAFENLREHALQDVAASEIQRVYRGLRGRKLFLSVLATYEAAVSIQRIYRQRGDLLKYLKRLQMQSRFAVQIQRIFRGWRGRVLARKVLLAYFQAEMAKIQADRAAFYASIRDRAARQLQRFCRKCHRHVQEKKADGDSRENRRVELEMQALLDAAARQKQEHKRAVTEYYDALREETRAAQARHKIDDKEKQKVTLLRRRREWEEVFRKRDETAAAKAREKAEKWTQLEVDWSAKVESRANLVRTQLQELLLRPTSKEQDAIKADLERRTTEHFKAPSGVAMESSEIRERAQHDVLEEEMEAERDRVRHEWTLAATAYKQREQDDVDRDRKAELQADAARKFAAATRIQRGAKVCLARRLLCRKVEALFLKEYDVPSGQVVYRNLRTGTLCPKPACLGSKDIPLLDKWYIVPDITGEVYYYNPKQLRQSWAKPEACIFCELCYARFASVYCPQHRKGVYADPIYACELCFAEKSPFDATLVAEAYAVDGART